MGKTALVLEGGAFRGVFTAGVLDFFMDEGIDFKTVVGVSSGACNAMNFVSKQRGRSFDCIMASDKPGDAYVGFYQMLGSGRFFNLDRLIFEYSLDRFPYDFNAFFASETDIQIPATDCETGEPKYFHDLKDEASMLDACKASCAVPMMVQPVMIDETPYLDGGVTVPIPLRRAEFLGCDRAVVVLTKDSEFEPHSFGPLDRSYKILFKDYPKIAERLEKRIDIYHEAMEYVRQRERDGTVIVIRPRIPTIDMLERDDDKLRMFYEHGRTMGSAVSDELGKFV